MPIDPSEWKMIKFFALHLETDARYDAPDRRLIYRMFGSDPEHRKSMELALETTLEISLVPAKLDGLNDKALIGATTARITQFQHEGQEPRQAISGEPWPLYIAGTKIRLVTTFLQRSPNTQAV